MPLAESEGKSGGGVSAESSSSRSRRRHADERERDRSGSSKKRSGRRDNDEEGSKSGESTRLRFKEKKKRHRDDGDLRDSSSRRRSGKSKHRHRLDDPTDTHSYSASGSASSSRLPSDPTGAYGADLFAAERAERARAKEQEWAEKLHELAAEDSNGCDDAPYFQAYSGAGAGPGAPFGTTHEEEDTYEANRARLDATPPSTHPAFAAQQIPARFLDSLGRTAPAFYARAGEAMTDEEHAEYMRQGMYRRMHAPYLQAQEEAAALRARQAAERKEKERERREKEKRKAEKRRERERAERKRWIAQARDGWDKQWESLRKPAAAGEKQEQAKPIYFSDLPWPCLSMWPATPEAGPRYPSLDKPAIREFLLDPIPTDASDDGTGGTESTSANNSKRLKTALLRYHPDRFFSASFFARIPEDGGLREKVRQAVLHVARTLNEISAEQREEKESAKQKE